MRLQLNGLTKRFANSSGWLREGLPTTKPRNHLCRYSPIHILEKPQQSTMVSPTHTNTHTSRTRTHPPLARVRTCPRPLQFPIPHVTCVVLAGPSRRHLRSIKNPHMACKKVFSHMLPGPGKQDPAHLCPSRFGYPHVSSSDELLRFRLPCPRSSPSCEGRTHSNSWHRYLTISSQSPNRTTSGSACSTGVLLIRI